MASTTLQLFRALAPDLCEEENGRVEIFLAAAARRLNPPAFGILFPDAAVYLAAHLLLRSPAGGSGGINVGGGGAVTSKKAGDLAIAFGSAASAVSNVALSDVDLLETHYGRQFLSIRDTRAAGAPTFIRI